MPDVKRPMPGRPVPPLLVGTVGGPCWRLCDQKPKHFTMLLVYRGMHCAGCCTLLKEIDARLGEFQKRGVVVVAASMDGRSRAEQTAESWDIQRLPIAYGISPERAREWGLFLSEGCGPDEPDLFAEFGIFLVRRDGTLQMASVQPMPLATPTVDELIASIDELIASGAPVRGGGELESTAAE